MRVKGLIFDFGFTLFSFENPSIEKYYDCFNRELLKSLDILKQEKIIEEKEIIIDNFIRIFNRKRNSFFKSSLKTKEEFPTTLLFKSVLTALKEKGYNIKDENVKEEFIENLAEIYHSCEEEEWKPYKETKYTLESLSKFSYLKIGLISNHPNHKTIKNLLKNNEIKQYFDAIVTSAKFGKRKPNPDIFFHTIKKMGLNKDDAKDCVMVGDEAADAVGAYRAGMQLILKEREFEFPFEREINLPNLIKIKSIREVLNYIE